MQELNNEQQAQWIGWQGAFYNIAKIFATGVLVYFAGVLIKVFSGGDTPTMGGTKMAWMSIMLIVGALMLLLGVYHVFRLPAGRPSFRGGVRGSGRRKGNFSRKYPFSSKIYCGFCGSLLTRRNWHSGKPP